MISIRLVDLDSDTDLEEFRRVRAEVVPGERAPSIAQLRARIRPGQIQVLAELDGTVVGSGIANHSDMIGSAVVTPRVVPGARRRGVGTELLRVLVQHAVTLGHPVVIGHADDAGSAAFAHRYGFTEVDRQVEQLWEVGPVGPVEVPAGIEIVPVAEARPGIWHETYERVGTQAFQDMALVTPMTTTLEEWDKEWIADPAATFVALADGEVVGCSGILPDEDQKDRAEYGLTAVRREYRGKGVASALKRVSMRWAADHGFRQVYTWTQRGNEDMRRLNEHLGFTYGAQSFTMRAPLPLSV